MNNLSKAVHEKCSGIIPNMDRETLKKEMFSSINSPESAENMTKFDDSIFEEFKELILETPDEVLNKVSNEPNPEEISIKQEIVESFSDIPEISKMNFDTFSSSATKDKIPEERRRKYVILKKRWKQVIDSQKGGNSKNTTRKKKIKITNKKRKLKNTKKSRRINKSQSKRKSKRNRNN